MGVRVVCDLRRDSQRKEDPDRLPAEDTPVTLHLDIAGAMDEEEESATAWSDEEAEAQMAERYALRMRTTGSLYGTMLDELNDPGNRPFLLHCQGGKDRAGTGAALLLLALGVPEEIVIEDYRLTDQALERAGVEPASIAGDFGLSVEVMEVVMLARPSFINAALDEMRALSTTVEGYLREHVGLTDEERDRLRAQLLH